MSSKVKKNERGGRRRGGPRRPPDRPKPPCAVCGEPIADITSALARSEDGAAVHFDCALQSAESRLKPKNGEKVIYLGSGSFAAVEESAYQNRSLKILRRFEWENRDSPREWRLGLRTRLR